MSPCPRRLLALFRPKLAVANGIAAGGGYLLLPTAPASVRLWSIMAGVTLLAAAGSAGNQVMERDLDRLMARTRCRPLPRGELTPAKAMALAGGCLAAGLLLLLPGGMLPVLLGGMTLGWYLGVYTPLKRRTPLALAAGALCGAMPPLIGWCDAGGSPTDFRILLLAGLLYLWQIPHFWLLQHRHQEDYHDAGLPIFSPRTKGRGPAGLCQLWIVALLAGSLLLPLFGLIGPKLACGYAAALLVLGTLTLIGSERALFTSLNLFPLLIPLVLYLQGWG